ncbi:MAG: hypothetical protein CH6_1079 [Candidatus Kapaibacterium sp.]|nr:MAG: hypothetical protein CH6_1079 [Candidatus Kapabacteria bacterium]
MKHRFAPRLEPTYKELKPDNDVQNLKAEQGLEPTYKELKPDRRER